MGFPLDLIFNFPSYTGKKPELIKPSNGEINVLPGTEVIINAKTDKISGCNALDKVLIDKSIPQYEEKLKEYWNFQFRTVKWKVKEKASSLRLYKNQGYFEGT